MSLPTCSGVMGQLRIRLGQLRSLQASNKGASSKKKRRCLSPISCCCSPPSSSWRREARTTATPPIQTRTTSMRSFRATSRCKTKIPTPSPSTVSGDNFLCYSRCPAMPRSVLPIAIFHSQKNYSLAYLKLAPYSVFIKVIYCLSYYFSEVTYLLL